ncbi:hypothetical protein CEUSTIGMA_g10694.t1 [Chlamydomonas eustigma]|uniref:Uncharacterized protein n=1 Tax=Chlamydomonas eustigma TaxID=1157962 RepID=A0A250XJM2_9CHLO|nr:hypothetical protein CEUSTIGMA_g10694.t1 [Chlamydomonas eustigma]|eukprot:GAX83268.1 hypothetical protein CEUSTIGMA_g10694.t1 [Chlamydomonas eustigma]
MDANLNSLPLDWDAILNKETLDQDDVDDFFSNYLPWFMNETVQAPLAPVDASLEIPKNLENVTDYDYQNHSNAVAASTASCNLQHQLSNAATTTVVDSRLTTAVATGLTASPRFTHLAVSSSSYSSALSLPSCYPAAIVQPAVQPSPSLSTCNDGPPTASSVIDKSSATCKPYASNNPHPPPLLLSQRMSIATATRPAKGISQLNIPFLEAELRHKVQLVKSLERTNEDLVRKEKLLSLQIKSVDRTIQCQRMQEGTSPHMTSLLQSFRMTVGLLGQHPEGGGGCNVSFSSASSVVTDTFTADELREAWCLFVSELSDIVVAGDKQCPRIHNVLDRMDNLLTSLSIHKSTLIPSMLGLHMKTGQPLPRTESFWLEVVLQLQLSQQQEKDIIAAHQAFSRVLKDVTCAMVKQIDNLSESVRHSFPKSSGLPADISWRQENGAEDPDACLGTAARSLGTFAQDQASTSWEADQATSCSTSLGAADQHLLIRKCLRQYSRYVLMQRTVYFVIQGLLTPWQRCLLYLTAYPSFPAHIDIMGALM